jgi:hypothetical protein
MELFSPDCGGQRHTWDKRIQADHLINQSDQGIPEGRYFHAESLLTAYEMIPLRMA